MMVDIRHRDDFVPPRHEKLPRRWIRINAAVADFIGEHILASLIMFDLAIILPLVCLFPGMHDLAAVTVILSSNWIQLWALPALQRSNNKVVINQDAKANVDHHNIMQILEILERLEKR